AVLYVAHNAGLLAPAFAYFREAIGAIGAVFGQTFGGIVDALRSGQFGEAAKIAWAGVQLAALVGGQQVLKGIDALWQNVGTITMRFFGSLNQLIVKVFSNIPKLIYTALRGGAGISEMLNSVFASAFANGDLASGLDPAIAAAQKRL